MLRRSSLVVGRSRLPLSRRRMRGFGARPSNFMDLGTTVTTPSILMNSSSTSSSSPCLYSSTTRLQQQGVLARPQPPGVARQQGSQRQLQKQTIQSASQRYAAQQNPLLQQTTPLVNTAKPLDAFLLQRQQQHYQYPYQYDSKEATETFAALLETLRLPSQRLVSSLPSPPPPSSTRAFSALEQSIPNDESDDNADDELNDSCTPLENMLLEAPPSELSVAPTLLLDGQEKSLHHSESATAVLPPAADVNNNDSSAVILASTMLQPPQFLVQENDSPNIESTSRVSREEAPVLRVPQTEPNVADLPNEEQQLQHASSSSLSPTKQQQVAAAPVANRRHLYGMSMSLLEIQGRILHHIRTHNTARAMDLFNSAVVVAQERQQQEQAQCEQEQEDDIEFLSPESVRQLFYLVSKKRPLDAHRVLLYYQQALHQQHVQQRQQHHPVAEATTTTTIEGEGMLTNRSLGLTTAAAAAAAAAAASSRRRRRRRQEEKPLLLYDAGMYERMCDVLRYLDPDVHNYTVIDSLVRRVIVDVLHKLDGPTTTSTTCTTDTTTHDDETAPKTDSSLIKKAASHPGRSGQERCISILVSALCAQRSVRLGRNFVPMLYQHMIKHEFTLTPGYLEHILGFSKYHRQDDLPFASILHKTVVDMNRQVDPVTILNCIEHLFPFTNMHDVALALESLIHLIKMSANSNSSSSAKSQPKWKQQQQKRYTLDISILEAMGAAAARQGNATVVLHIWDLIDLLGYAPTAMIYENTVLAFCENGPAFYPQMFSILQDMSSQGHAPSRALVRGLSTRLRHSLDNLEEALDALLTMAMQSSESPPHHSEAVIAGFNAILSAYAERGKLEEALQVFERIQTTLMAKDDMDCGNGAIAVANEDTYGFLFEATGKHLVISRRQQRNRRRYQRHRRRYDHDEEDDERLVARCWQCADSLLTQMENQGIAPTTHILREYIELLCQMNDVATATTIVRETVEAGSTGDKNGDDDNNSKGPPSPAIGNKILYRVAMANAKIQNFDIAREIAKMGSEYNHEPMPFLLERINAMERADAHVVYGDEDMYEDVYAGYDRIPHYYT